MVFGCSQVSCELVSSFVVDVVQALVKFLLLQRYGARYVVKLLT